MIQRLLIALSAFLTESVLDPASLTRDISLLGLTLFAPPTRTSIISFSAASRLLGGRFENGHGVERESIGGGCAHLQLNQLFLNPSTKWLPDSTGSWWDMALAGSAAFLPSAWSAFRRAADSDAWRSRVARFCRSCFWGQPREADYRPLEAEMVDVIIHNFDTSKILSFIDSLVGAIWLFLKLTRT